MFPNRLSYLLLRSTELFFSPYLLLFQEERRGLAAVFWSGENILVCVAPKYVIRAISYQEEYKVLKIESIGRSTSSGELVSLPPSFFCSFCLTQAHSMLLSLNLKFLPICALLEAVERKKRA